MYIIAFETSCDDTSLAVFKNDELVSMDTMSQIRIHNRTNGVVPEVAAREHANNIFDVLETVLDRADITLQDIDHIAVTTHPGLLPSLLTGVTVASTISQSLGIPIIAVNHIEAHIFSNFLGRKESDISFPLICLTASGGHTEIYFMKDMFHLDKVGGTQDDAAGEAFDKVAKMMSLGYPGGPIISTLASEWEEKNGLKSLNKHTNKPLFPRVWLKKDEAEFSFSGLKTAVKREIERRTVNKDLTSVDKQEIAYEFSEAILEVLAYKFADSANKKGVNTLLLAGGVSANEKLRALITGQIKNSQKLFFPTKKIYCIDNAAMIGITAYYKIKYKKFKKHIGALAL